MNTTFNIALGVLLIACGLRELGRIFENRKNNNDELKEQATKEEEEL